MSKQTTIYESIIDLNELERGKLFGHYLDAVVKVMTENNMTFNTAIDYSDLIANKLTDKFEVNSANRIDDYGFELVREIEV